MDVVILVFLTCSWITIAKELDNNYRDYLASIEDKIREASLMVLDGNIPEDTIGNNITSVTSFIS